MRFLLYIFLILFFIYSLALVIFNYTSIEVHLIFMQFPAMNLGLLLILTIFIGFCIGMMVAILVFKVLQKQLELSRLKKHNTTLQSTVEKLTDQIKELNVNDSVTKQAITDKY